MLGFRTSLTCPLLAFVVKKSNEPITDVCGLSRRNGNLHWTGVSGAIMEHAMQTSTAVKVIQVLTIQFIYGNYHNVELNTWPIMESLIDFWNLQNIHSDKFSADSIIDCGNQTLVNAKKKRGNKSCVCTVLESFSPQDNRKIKHVCIFYDSENLKMHTKANGNYIFIYS